jgi:hypothetical protein
MSLSNAVLTWFDFRRIHIRLCEQYMIFYPSASTAGGFFYVILFRYSCIFAKAQAIINFVVR